MKGAAPRLATRARQAGPTPRSAAVHMAAPVRLAAGLAGAAVVAGVLAVDTAPFPIEIVRADAGRCPAPAEAAAYFTVTEAVADAADRGAGCATVTIVHEGGRLVVTVKDDGAVRATSLAALSDRVGALGGSLLIQPTLCRAEIPCVSS